MDTTALLAFAVHTANHAPDWVGPVIMVVLLVLAVLPGLIAVWHDR
jgi:hypothetical protein